ncbi:GNAT family N-acetyltransferase [Streptosporangium sp. NPDC051022]|uniref:GNAT family N-acetyltransferase n=1 Tax=Streptosporangium sp. NPDC051022 TaxID=3155752 RepID=UPI00341B927C
MTTPVRVLDACAAGRDADAGALIFEYMAATQVELGRPAPAAVDELSASLRDECRNPALAYRAPGVFLVAYRDDTPVGCVGLKPVPGTDAAEIKRLYARPAHRGGVGRILMHHAHEHAELNGFARLVLDVMPQRRQVIDLYRRLGYTDAGTSARYSSPMLSMERRVCPSGALG